MKKIVLCILYRLGIINWLQAFLASLEVKQEYPSKKKIPSKCNLKLREKK